MKKAAAILIILSTAIALCAWGPAAADPRTRYPVEENTGGNRATYPYIVRTESATWYLSADDIALLGEDAFYRGLYEVLENQEADFADAREALSGFIFEEVEPIDIYTDFCGKAGISGEKLVGAYYNPLRSFIKVFKGWGATKFALLHEYVHYLTLRCTAAPVTHGLFAEGIADYVSMIVCRNRMARDSFATTIDPETTEFLKAHGAWDEEEGCVDPRLYWLGSAESFAIGQEMGTEYLSTADVAVVRTAEIQQDPAPDMISHMEAAGIMAYLAETYTRETLLGHMDMDPAGMEEVFGEPFPEIYEHWKVWNTERCAELGLIM